MSVGDLSVEGIGIFEISGAALRAVINSINLGGATAGADTKTMDITYVGNGQVQLLTYERAAA